MNKQWACLRTRLKGVTFTSEHGLDEALKARVCYQLTVLRLEQRPWRPLRHQSPPFLARVRTQSLPVRYVRVRNGLGAYLQLHRAEREAPPREVLNDIG